MSQVITLIVGLLIVGLLGIFVIFPISNVNVDGEFEEGWVYGVFEEYEISEPVCCSYHGSTEIKLEGQGWLWFHYNCEYIMEDNLEEGKVYGFYYTSSEVQYAITREFGEPQGRWLPYIDKIVDCENNVLWESHYGDIPQVCWTSFFVIAIVLILPIAFYLKWKEKGDE